MLVVGVGKYAFPYYVMIVLCNLMGHYSRDVHRFFSLASLSMRNDDKVTGIECTA